MAKKKREWSAYTYEGRRNLETIGPETPLEDLCAAIERNVPSLNHEDEYVGPAYLEAVRRLRLARTRYMAGNP